MIRALQKSMARRLSVSAVALGLFGASPAMAELRGLVVGINDYVQLESLDGAVNDARDVAGALRRAGASDVKLLLDREATRDAVMQAWNETVARSTPGDILVFHYAGHGGQSPERIKGSERTGMDSELLLAAFTAEAPGNYERIVDDEIHVMLKRATDAGLAVLLATDACHSGTMTRGFDTRLSRPKVRAALHAPITDDRLPAPDPQAASMTLDDLPNVVSLGAVQDDELAPEVIIDGQPRGALSWSLARGLEGGADLDKDGAISEKELQVFVWESVRVVMEGQQHPSILRTRGGGRVIEWVIKPLVGDAAGKVAEAIFGFAIDRFKQGLSGEEMVPEKTGEPKQIAMEIPVIRIDPGGQSKTPPVPGQVALPSLSLRLINADEESIKAWRRNALPEGVTLVGDSHADLIWDVSRGEVLNGLSDLVAYVGKNRPNRGGATGSPTRGFGRLGQAAVTSAAPPVHLATLEGRSEDWKLVHGVIDKWRLVLALRELGISGGLNLSLSPGDQYYRKGDKATVTVTGMRHPYFALFNLTSVGTVEILYPQAGESPAVPQGQFTLPLVVQPPYGADHFIALSADTPLKKVLDGLARSGAEPSAREFARLLETHIGNLPHQVGLHGVYTTPWAQ